MNIQSKKTSWLLPVAMAVAGLLLLMAATAQGQGTGAAPGDLAQPEALPLFWAEDFSDPLPPETYYITATTGSGMVVDDYFLLTLVSAPTAQRGRIFYLAPAAMVEFSASFHLYLGSNDYIGADGAAFHFCPVYNYPPAVGSALDALCPGGYLVAFDTYEDGGGPDRVYVAHETPSNRLVSEDVDNLEDGLWHTATVLFQQPFITVTLDGIDVIAGADLTPYTPFSGYFGFSAATGGLSNEQRVDEIQVYAPEGPSSVVDGYVTDATTGWPLYASVDTNSPAGVVWTDPETGYYSITLPEGMAFDFHVEAWVPGYVPEDRVVGPLAGDTTESFALDADLDTCLAPGYQWTTYYFFEDFEAGDGGYTHSGVYDEWEWGMPTTWPSGCASGDLCWGTDLDGNYENNANNELLSVVIDLSSVPPGTPLVAKWWQAWHIESATWDHAYAEVSIGGGAWTEMWSHTGGTVQVGWTEMSYDISAAAGSTVQFRWRMTSDSSVTYSGYYIDMVSISGGCDPAPGGLVVGNVYDENTLDPLVGAKVENDTGGETYALPTPADPNLDDAFYTLFSPPGNHDFTASFVPPWGTDDETVMVVNGDTVGQDFYLPAPHLVLDPEELEVWVLYETPVYSHPTGLDLINDGGLPLDFELVEISGTTTLLLGESQVTVAGVPAEAPAGTAVTPEGASSPDVLFQPGEPRINLQSILHIYTTDTSQSVQRALNELGYAYDTYSGTDWTGINFSPYDIVIIGMDGGLVEAVSIQKLRTDVVDQGKRVILMGGTCYQPFALGVNQYLVLNDTNNYCWTISNTPHFTVVDPGHPLAQGLPPSYNFINSSAAYYQTRATDLDLEVVALNGDGYDDLFYKNMNFPLGEGSPAQGGDLIWFINSVYTSYWTNQADFDVLKQIVSNSITFSGAGGDVPWFWEVPVSGTVPANDVQNVAIGFTALYPDLTPMPLGDYYATLEVHSNDPVSDTQHVPVTMHIVEEFITPTASFESNSPVCEGTEMVFTNTTTVGIPGDTGYLWDFGDGETSTEFEPTHVYAAPGTYDVTLEACNAAGCDTYSDVVEILPLPQAGFTYDVAGFDVSFANTSLDALSYEWDFGDGTSSTDQNPVHTYAAADTYTVILTATNDCGVDVYTEQVEVIGLYYYYLPLIQKNNE